MADPDLQESVGGGGRGGGLLSNTCTWLGSLCEIKHLSLKYKGL